MTDLAGVRVVITGSGDGLGAAYAKGAAALGAEVVVNDINAESAERVVDAIRQSGGKAVAEVGSVSDPSVAEALVQRCIAEFGSITSLVSNAGIGFAKVPLEQETAERVRGIFDVNVMGVFNCGRACVTPMLRQGFGTIINVTSGSSAGQASLSTYGATKGAISSFTYAWAAELYPRGIRVNAYSPMAATPGVNYNPILPPVEGNVAPLLYLLSDRAKQINGQVIRVIGKKLSLMAHPANRMPVIERDTWTIESVAEAFDSTLAAKQLPTNVANYDIASVIPENSPAEKMK